MRTLMTLLLLALVIVLCWFGWKHYQTARVLDSGEVHCDGCLTGERKAAFLRENSGEGPDGQSEHKWDFSRGADGQKREYSDADDPNYHGPVYTSDQQAAPPETRASGEPYDRVYTGGPAPGAVPVRDTIPPNPPNGEKFGGRGAYEWYRQGNVTWRTNTMTGQSCIAYATMAEWRKRIVMDHGCGFGA